MLNIKQVAKLTFILLASLSLMPACSPEAEDTPSCPEDTYRDGEVCVRDNTIDRDMAQQEDMGDTTDDVGAPDDTGMDDAGTDLMLPFAVDDAGYVPSGFFGDGETPGAIVMDNVCPMRAGDEEGACHHVLWTPGVGSQGFAGVYWQYPANNFGMEPGLQLPQGATEVTFHAWGASGGEVVEFLSGLGGDEYQERIEVTLTDTPTEYSVSLCDVTYDEVVSAFGWVAADSTDPVEFYVDDIVMGVADEDCEDPMVDIMFPFSVDEVGYVPSGFFGDGETPGAVTMDNSCPMRSDAGAVGNCHNVTWTTGVGTAGFAGAFWQFPENNFGMQDGLDLPAGATGVRFDAWGATGGEEVNFFSGTSEEVDGFNRETGAITLTATPIEYEIDLRCVEYTDVAGAFGWGAGGVTSGSVQFYIDNIRWVDDGDTSMCDAPAMSLSLPFWIDAEESGYVPSGFMGDDTGITMSNDCPMRGDVSAQGNCHKATWVPTAGSPGWAGVFWQYPENNWGTLPGRTIDAGATSISFYAWGETGGEVVKFGSGYATEDGFARETTDITLTTTPTQYTIDLTGVTYTDVAGVFNWTSAQVGGVTFYIDDIHWQ